MGDGGGGEPELAGKLLHRGGMVGEQADDLQPVGVCQGFKKHQQCVWFGLLYPFLSSKLNRKITK